MAFGDAGGVDVLVTAALPQFLHLTLAGTVEKGDPIGYDSGWVRAYASTGQVVQARYVALESGVDGDVIQVAREAILAPTPVYLVKGEERGGGRFSGATIDGIVYVAEAPTAGKYTQTKPTTSNDSETPIGRAIAADTLHIRCQSEPDSTV